MFVQDPVCQNPVCQDPVCQDQVCQDHVCQDHVMFVKTISSMSGPCHVCLEYVIFLRPCHRPAMSCLSRICHFFDHVCQEYVIFLRPCHVCHDSVYKFNMFCKHILSTCFVNNFPSFITKISQTWKSKTTTKICIGLRCMRSQSKSI